MLILHVDWYRENKFMYLCDINGTNLVGIVDVYLIGLVYCIRFIRYDVCETNCLSSPSYVTSPLYSSISLLLSSADWQVANITVIFSCFCYTPVSLFFLSCSLNVIYRLQPLPSSLAFPFLCSFKNSSQYSYASHNGFHLVPSSFGLYLFCFRLFCSERSHWSLYQSVLFSPCFSKHTTERAVSCSYLSFP